MSVVKDYDELLDKILDERAIGHLDFTPSCQSIEPQCAAPAAFELKCRTFMCTTTVMICAAHLDALRGKPQVCLACKRSGSLEAVVRVTPVGGVS